MNYCSDALDGQISGWLPIPTTTRKVVVTFDLPKASTQTVKSTLVSRPPAITLNSRVSYNSLHRTLKTFVRPTRIHDCHQSPPYLSGHLFATSAFNTTPPDQYFHLDDVNCVHTLVHASFRTRPSPTDSSMFVWL